LQSGSREGRTICQSTPFWPQVHVRSWSAHTWRNGGCTRGYSERDGHIIAVSPWSLLCQYTTRRGRWSDQCRSGR